MLFRSVARLARKDWLKNLQTAYFKHRVSLRHARTKSHFVRYFGVASRNVHFVEQLARALLPAEFIDRAEAELLARIDTAMREVDKETERAHTLLAATSGKGLFGYDLQGSEPVKWERPSSDLIDPKERLPHRYIRVVAVGPDQHIFLGTQDGGIFRSTDRGVSWHTLSRTLPTIPFEALLPMKKDCSWPPVEESLN